MSDQNRAGKGTKGEEEELRGEFATGNIPEEFGWDEGRRTFSWRGFADVGPARLPLWTTVQAWRTNSRRGGRGGSPMMNIETRRMNL